MDAVEPADVADIGDWCSLWIKGAVRNQPIRMDGQRLEVEVGYGTFWEAAQAWRTICTLDSQSNVPVPEAAWPEEEIIRKAG